LEEGRGSPECADIYEKFRVVVRVVIQAASVDETLPTIVGEVLEMNSNPAKTVSVDETAEISGP
jgi:hypothetical protein